MKIRLLLLTFVLPLFIWCQNDVAINQKLSSRMGCSLVTKDTTPHLMLRCYTTLKTGNEPLLILDGNPVTSTQLSAINPNTIDSIFILKDTAATALYGCRAVDGVIIITSKKQIIIRDDETGEAIANASVKINFKSGWLEIMADPNGIIAMPKDKYAAIKTVTASCIGYEPKTVLSPVNTNQPIIVSLSKKNVLLSNVVVAGYSNFICKCYGYYSDTVSKATHFYDSKSHQPVISTCDQPVIKTGIKIYPNPVSRGGQLTITSEHPISSYQIFSSAGLLMQEGVINANKSLAVYINQYAAGAYIIRLVDRAAGKTFSQPFIIQ